MNSEVAKEGRGSESIMFRAKSAAGEMRFLKGDYLHLILQGFINSGSKRVPHCTMAKKKKGGKKEAADEVRWILFLARDRR